MESLASAVLTSSTKQRVRIFRSEIPSVILDSEMSSESASQLVDLIFMTLYIYEDKESHNAVDDIIIKYLNQVIFMKVFAANLVQTMEKQLKLQSHDGCNRLMKWSTLLLCKSQFISVSKNAFSRVAAAQASCIQISVQASSLERTACKKTFIHSLLESPSIFSLYLEELKGGTISYKSCPEFLCVMLDYSSSMASLFEQWKLVYLEEMAHNLEARMNELAAGIEAANARAAAAEARIVAAEARIVAAEARVAQAMEAPGENVNQEQEPEEIPVEDEDEDEGSVVSSA